MSKRGWRRRASAVILGLITIATAASFLPLVEANAWWVRYMDFPRLQLAIALILLLIAFLAMRPRIGAVGWAASLLAALALGYHAYELYPYGAPVAETAVGVEDCPADSAIAVMIANVQERNENADTFLRVVADADPDILLIMETDSWWDRHLIVLEERFPERVQHIPEGGGAFGMHLLSKLPLISPEFRFLFDAFTPTALAGVELRNGKVIQFLGMHPQPPLAWSQPTTLRDAHLLTAALEAQSSAAPTIVAGDFNSVPWERVTRRAIRIGGLLDPRIGRGYHPTFMIGSLLISWPVDQILYQDSFGLLEFRVLPPFGSDHLAVLARLCHAPALSQLQSAPQLEENDIKQAEAAIQAARSINPEERR